MGRWRSGMSLDIVLLNKKLVIEVCGTASHRIDFLPTIIQTFIFMNGVLNGQINPQNQAQIYAKC